MSALTSVGSGAPLRTPTPAGEHPAYRWLARAAGAVCRLVVREEWGPSVGLPAEGGVLVVSNHTSYADVVLVGRYLIWHGRWPRYLGKADLWRVPVVGWFARRCLQIPVERGTVRARDALVPAMAALAAGECVAIYPEGGRTRDPDWWPMLPRTGAARLALATGVPVVPVVSWGAHAIMPGRRLSFPRLGRTVRVRAGDAVDLSDLAGGADDPAAVREATRRIGEAVTRCVADLRGEPVPSEVWDPKLGRRVPRD